MRPNRCKAGLRKQRQRHFRFEKRVGPVVRRHAMSDRSSATYVCLERAHFECGYSRADFVAIGIGRLFDDRSDGAESGRR